MTAPKKQAGLSLIELMVTILLSSLLLLGVLQLYINTNATDRTSNELARVQESGRVAIEIIAREARRTGYQGCVGSSVETTAGGITYPEEAITGTATSLTFNYARSIANPASPLGSFPNRNCVNGILEPYQITFRNCGNNLCVTAPDIGVNQELVANANFTRIEFIEPCGANTCSRSAADANMALTQKLQITLSVNDSRGEFDAPRAFTSVIELRNRL